MHCEEHVLQLLAAISPTAELPEEEPPLPEEEPPCKLLHNALHVAIGCIAGSAISLLTSAAAFCHVAHGSNMHCKRA